MNLKNKTPIGLFRGVFKYLLLIPLLSHAGENTNQTNTTFSWPNFSITPLIGPLSSWGSWGYCHNQELVRNKHLPPGQDVVGAKKVLKIHRIKWIEATGLAGMEERGFAFVKDGNEKIMGKAIHNFLYNPNRVAANKEYSATVATHLKQIMERHLQVADPEGIKVICLPAAFRSARKKIKDEFATGLYNVKPFSLIHTDGHPILSPEHMFVGHINFLKDPDGKRSSHEMNESAEELEEILRNYQPVRFINQWTLASDSQGNNPLIHLGKIFSNPSDVSKLTNLTLPVTSNFEGFKIPLAVIPSKSIANHQMIAFKGMKAGDFHLFDSLEDAHGSVNLLFGERYIRESIENRCFVLKKRLKDSLSEREWQVLQEKKRMELYDWNNRRNGIAIGLKGR